MSGITYFGAKILDAKGELSPHEAIAVSGKGVIKFLGSLKQAREKFPKYEVAVEKGLITPGLLNLHCHLDLSWARGKIPASLGLYDWILALRQLPFPTPNEVNSAMLNALEIAQSTGTCFMVNHSGNSPTLATMTHMEMSGIILFEVMGRTPKRVKERCRELEVELEDFEDQDSIRVGLCIHAPYSVHQSQFKKIIKACQSAPCFSFHYAESPFEAQDWRGLSPETENFLTNLGVSWEPQSGTKKTPLTLAAKHYDGPILAVHGQHAETYQEALWQGALPVLCPRSSFHIANGPRDPRELKKFALGTDSLASAPDLNIASEAALLFKKFKGLPAQTLWQALTSWPAEHLKLKQFGEIKVGHAPGLVLFNGKTETTNLLEKALFWKSELLVSPGPAFK